MELRPIGVIRSDVRDRKAMPPLGAPGIVEIFPEYEEALQGFEKHTHIWVLAWLDGAERDVLRVKPRGLKDGGEEALHGVFAVRSPARPNPIGLTATRVLSRDGTRIHAERIDFVDGTPVIDIKPYFVTRDVIPVAQNKQIGKSANREALRQSLAMQASHFTGPLNADAAAAVRILEHFRYAYYSLDDVTDWDIIAPLDHPSAIDAFFGMTRVMPGSGKIHFTRTGPVVFGYRSQEHRILVEYILPASLPPTAEAVLTAPDEEIFTHIERSS